MSEGVRQRGAAPRSGSLKATSGDGLADKARQGKHNNYQAYLTIIMS